MCNLGGVRVTLFVEKRPSQDRVEGCLQQIPVGLSEGESGEWDVSLERCPGQHTFPWRQIDDALEVEGLSAGPRRGSPGSCGRRLVPSSLASVLRSVSCIPVLLVVREDETPEEEADKEEPEEEELDDC